MLSCREGAGATVAQLPEPRPRSVVDLPEPRCRPPTGTPQRLPSTSCVPSVYPTWSSFASDDRTSPLTCGLVAPPGRFERPTCGLGMKPEEYDRVRQMPFGLVTSLRSFAESGRAHTARSKGWASGWANGSPEPGCGAVSRLEWAREMCRLFGRRVDARLDRVQLDGEVVAEQTPLFELGTTPASLGHLVISTVSFVG